MEPRLQNNNVERLPAGGLPERRDASGGGAELSPQQPERYSAQQETRGEQQGSSVSTQDLADAAAQLADDTAFLHDDVSLQDVSQAVIDEPVVASDADKIEEVWVKKAKAIIARTRDDPRAQEEQVGKLKAEYIKVRFGKEIGKPLE